VSNPVLDAIRTRRIARNLTERPVERALLEQILEAARWSPNAGNRRLQRFVALDDRLTLRLLRMVSPGMFQRPTAAVLICIDRERVRSFGMRTTLKGLSVDVGTAAQTILLAAHSLGLGSGIVTSFSQAAVSAILNLPERLSPELFVCLGYAAPAQPLAMRARTPVTWQGLTDWGRFPRTTETPRESKTSV
jgi:nitroreductase